MLQSASAAAHTFLNQLHSNGIEQQQQQANGIVECDAEDEGFALVSSSTNSSQKMNGPERNHQVTSSQWHSNFRNNSNYQQPVHQNSSSSSLSDEQLQRTIEQSKREAEVQARLQKEDDELMKKVLELSLTDK